ncbi:MAG: alkaline phosphatase family protein [Acidimicrobiales bacterium]
MRIAATGSLFRAATLAAIVLGLTAFVPPAAARSVVRSTPTRNGVVRRVATGNGVPAFSHVFVVVMENLGYQSTLGTPGFAALARRYALATNYYSVAHPSLPNYLALTSGSTWGITSDCVECYVNEPNLAEQLHEAHVSFAAYMEGAPRRCFLADYGGNDYASKHDPFRYYDDVRASRALCDAIEPEDELPRLLSGPEKSVPRFVWVTPNLCHDGHDCAPSTAAAWLDRFVNEVTKSSAWRDNGVVFVTWDESEGSDSTVAPTNRVVACCGGGQVATFVIAPKLRPDLRVNVAYSHYSLLATIEDAFRLPLLQNARRATPLSAFFDTRSP